MGQLAKQMAQILIDKERARLIQEASDIADAATRFARNVDSSVACGDATQIARAARDLAERATRVAAMREVFELYEAEAHISYE
jgi:hypothetical protein